MARRHFLLMLVVSTGVLSACSTATSLAPAVSSVPANEAGRVFGSLGVSSQAPTIDYSSLQFRQAGFRTGCEQAFSK